MFKVIFLLPSLFLVSIQAAKMVCYYDSTSHDRIGPAQLSLQDLEPALQFCEYLVYGYAGIDAESYQLRPLNNDLDVTRNHYREIINLRRNHPQLLVLLSVGGGRDDFDHADDNPYLRLLESQAHRNTFVDSSLALLKAYDFDGLDLAWQFPKNKPILVRWTYKKVWNFLKNIFVDTKVVDKNAEEHKIQFATLVDELKHAFLSEGYILTLTMLPHVDAGVFIDIPKVIPLVDFVNLGSYDFQTPERDPYVADHTGPIYEMRERDPTLNIDYQVQYWINNSAPSNKINIGVAAYASSWMMTSDSDATSYPPIQKTDGPGPAGKQIRIPGLMSWPEMCGKLQHYKELDSEDAPLRSMTDPQNTAGNIAYGPGLWVSYVEPNTASVKADYVSTNQLGGVALFDLSLDDFRGQCTTGKYAILKAIKVKL